MTPTELWLRDVSRVSRVPLSTLIGPCRKREVVRLRQALMFVMVRKLKLSNPQTGKHLGGLDHSTVIHGVRTLEDLMRRSDPVTLRAYRIVIRCFVRVQQAERASRAQMRQFLTPARTFGMMDPSTTRLLERCRDQFAFYAQQHENKQPPQLEKAQINSDLAVEINQHLTKLVGSPDRITHPEMVELLQKPGEAIAAHVTPLQLDVLHMAVGVAGEAGELLDAIKKWVFYNKPLDMENVVEELGDIEFYLQGLRARLGIGRDRTLEHNIDKLLVGEKARYKDGYTDEAAHARRDKA